MTSFAPAGYGPAMKSVTLLRHAKSSWDDPVERDFDRPLNDRGWRAARTVGRHLAENGTTWDTVIASPAVRVVETLSGVEEGLGRRLDADFDRRIYMASAATLLDILQEADESAERLLLVGHNPSIEDLVFLLVPPQHRGARSDIEVKYPTAALCEIEIEAARWEEVTDGMGKIANFVRPRDLDPKLGPDT